MDEIYKACVLSGVGSEVGCKVGVTCAGNVVVRTVGVAVGTGVPTGFCCAHPEKIKDIKITNIEIILRFIIQYL
jgi:hypothetical protein